MRKGAGACIHNRSPGPQRCSQVKSAALHRELTASSQALPPLPHIPGALTSQPAEGAMAECADTEPKTASAAQLLTFNTPCRSSRGARHSAAGKRAGQVFEVK